MRNSYAFLILGLIGCVGSRPEPPPRDRPHVAREPVPTAREIAAFTEARPGIAPAVEERGFGPIDWLAGLENGLAVAHELDRPLLLWIMSADPLTCDCPGELSGSRGNLGAAELAPLQAEFVGAVDIVWAMQTAQTPAAQLFRSGLDEPPRAGFYALAPSGLVLAQAHSLQPDDLHGAFAEALESWFELDRPSRSLPNGSGLSSHKRRRPDSGLVLTAWGRDEGSASTTVRAIRRDQVWIETLDARSLLPIPPTTGSRADASRPIARLLAQRAFLDDMRGRTPPFTDDQVDRASLHAEVTAIDGPIASLVLWGSTRATAPGVGGPRGVETTLVGRATIDTESLRFTSFELLARGTRWGRSETNARRGQEAPSPVAFLVELTPEGAWRYAAPR